MRSLYIVRGLPGSGKTTLARMIAPNSNYAADDFFMHDGEYLFRPDLLSKAHADCQSRVKAAMVRGDNVIVVHNTFVKAWEADPYFSMAKENGYSVSVIVCSNNFGSIHGVPEEAINRMRQNWEWF